MSHHPDRWDHSNRVGVFRGTGFRAKCSYCWYYGPFRESKNEAMQDMDKHAATEEHQRKVREMAG